MFGGRPMKIVTSCLFMDVVVNKPVNLYVDKKGRYWMCLDRWGENKLGQCLMAVRDKIRSV